jgi:hypothetical protein
MGIEILLAAEGHGLLHDKSIPIIPVFGKGQASQVVHGDANELVGGKFGYLRPEHLLKGINDMDMNKGRCPIGHGQFVMGMVRTQLVQFLKAQVVLGYPHELLPGPVPKIDPYDGTDPIFGGLSDKIETGGGIVDVGQGQFRHAVPLCHLQEFGLGKGAKTERIIAVTVQVHFLFYDHYYKSLLVPMGQYDRWLPVEGVVEPADGLGSHGGGVHHLSVPETLSNMVHGMV